MEAEKVYHFVHIGYDNGEHPRFERKLKSLIGSISERASEIVSFVDVPDFYIEHPTKARKIVNIDMFIADYFIILTNIWIYRSTWNPKINQHLARILAKIPPEIKEFLQEELGDNFFAFNEKDLLEGLTEKDFERILAVGDFYENRRLSLLQKARNRFLGKREFAYSDESYEGTPDGSNQLRRQRIGEYAVEILGPERVHQTYMPNGGFFPEKNPPKIIQNGSAYELYNSYLIRALVSARFRGLVDIHRNAYIEKGWLIGEGTIHVVVGEYRDRCVKTFAKVLTKSLGCNNVQIDDEYTLEAGKVTPQ